MKTKLIYLALAFALSFVYTSCDKNEDDQPNQSPNPSYASASQFITDMEFIGAAFVRKGNQVLVSQGYGLANEADRSLNSPDLIYRIGSVTKQFTAMAIVQLKRDGLIQSFDQSLSEFDGEFPEGDRITLKHLLRHHSGIPDYVGAIEDYAESTGTFVPKEYILDAITDAIEEDGLQFEPGEFFSYSNSNYFILGILVEELTGIGFDEYLQLNVFAPLGMINTKPGHDEITLPTHARGYNNSQEVSPYQMQIAFSAGYLESNVPDLERWADAMMGDFLTTNEKEQVFEPPFGQERVATVGFGWFTGTVDGKLVHYHGGNIDGFSALIGLFPETNSLIILLSNRTDETEQLDTILRTIAKNEF